MFRFMSYGMRCVIETKVGDSWVTYQSYAGKNRDEIVAKIADRKNVKYNEISEQDDWDRTTSLLEEAVGVTELDIYFQLREMKRALRAIQNTANDPHVVKLASLALSNNRKEMDKIEKTIDELGEE